MKNLNDHMGACAGFTLLEVMLAMGIMMITFTSIFMVQNSSINASVKAKRMNYVSMLARQQMTLFEMEFQGKEFNDVKKESSGTFESPYQDYRWKRTVKEIKFPDLGMGQSAKEGESGGKQAADTLGKLVTKFFTAAIREITVTISWKRGPGEQTYTVSSYWVDLNHEFALSE